MKVTPISGLAGTFVFFGLAVWILTRAFYGQMGPISARATLTLWFLAVVCAVLSWRVRDRKSSGKIGMDRSQLSPLAAANFLVIGKASAWTGAIVGGAYAGIAAHILPHYNQLTAAAADTPGVLSGALAGLAVTVAGVVLERSCQVPPPADGEAA
ncbi:DUF3180 domain-containing protein [Staphylococcus chromogenes]|nr:DUF3180 domain-containing protein [Staphylococcus chromogenes]